MRDALKVSVAMCTFNGAKFVEAQLQSIFQQTRVPDEIIVCDDVSTDATVEVLRKVAAKDPVNIQIHQNSRNLGYLENFESAVRRTTGDIIFLSDQDDVWLPEKVATMVEPFLRNPQVVLAYSDAMLTDAD